MLWFDCAPGQRLGAVRCVSVALAFEVVSQMILLPDRVLDKDCLGFVTYSR